MNISNEKKITNFNEIYNKIISSTNYQEDELDRWIMGNNIYEIWHSICDISCESLSATDYEQLILTQLRTMPFRKYTLFKEVFSNFMSMHCNNRWVKIEDYFHKGLADQRYRTKTHNELFRGK